VILETDGGTVGTHGTVGVLGTVGLLIQWDSWDYRRNCLNCGTLWIVGGTVETVGTAGGTVGTHGTVGETEFLGLSVGLLGGWDS